MGQLTSVDLSVQPAKTSGLVVRVAIFSNQGRLDDYREFIGEQLFRTLRTVPGYVGTFLGCDAASGQLISLSFWRGEADAVAGEEAVGRAIRELPQGSAPRPTKVEKYVVEYSDIKEPLSIVRTFDASTHAIIHRGGSDVCVDESVGDRASVRGRTSDDQRQPHSSWNDGSKRSDDSSRGPHG